MSKSFINRDIYSQIGLVMLIGFAAKNAILIGELRKISTNSAATPCSSRSWVSLTESGWVLTVSRVIASCGSSCSRKKTPSASCSAITHKASHAGFPLHYNSLPKGSEAHSDTHVMPEEPSRAGSMSAIATLRKPRASALE